MNYQKQIDWLRERLQQPLPGLAGQERMAARVVPMPDTIPADARPSAVLSTLFPKNDALHIILIERGRDKSAHSGQIAFPGGKQEKSDADLKATALREAQEEVGIVSADVDILGELTPLYIPVSKFRVHPYVAFAKENLAYNINQREVSRVLEIPLHEFRNPANKTVLDVVSPAVPDVIRKVKAYQIDGTVIWGATAMILSELETVLEEYY